MGYINMKTIDRQKMIIAAMASGGEGAIFSPVQIQKMFFLIDREATKFVGGPYFNFEAYDYGPYDSEVYVELSQLKDQGLANIRRDSHYNNYSLTAEGFKQGKEVLEDSLKGASSALQKIATWILQRNFQQIVTAIYTAYPEMKEKSIFLS